MLTVVTALYPEAQPLLQYYHLKKNQTITKFQVFENEEIRLLITNTGSIAASIGVSCLSTLYPPAPSDYLINIGVCGARDQDIPAGSLFLCNKIIEEATGHSFYPDLLLAHPFRESGILTCSKVIEGTEKRDTGKSEAAGKSEDLLKYEDTGKSEYIMKSENSVQNEDTMINKDVSDAALFDMEAAGIYQAAAYFYQPHQISFIKIVSDFGTKEKFDPETVAGLVKCNLSTISEWLDQLTKIRQSDKPVFTLEEEECVKGLINHFHCSVTKEYQLRQQLHYYKLVHGGFISRIKEFYHQNSKPCNTKAEGKMQFEQLKAEFI